MIKNLQRKFITITMISLLLILVFLIGSINILNVVQMNRKVDGVIQLLSQNKGEFPNPDKNKFNDNDSGKGKFGGDNPGKINPAFGGFQMSEETPYETRYFTVKVGEDGTVQEINTSHIKAVTSSDAQEYANTIMSNHKVSGFEGRYKYGVIEQDGGFLIIFVDCQSQLQTAMFFLLTSIGVGLITLILMFVLVSVFSRRAIKPIIESMEKQKQFITDAGHEIKTPLAIISANADVLELTGGENEWITSIRNQTTRLDKLVKNLLMLSKIEEGSVKKIFTDFDISKTVYETAAPFEAIAETQNKKMEMHIQSGLKLFGDESSMQQLISTLVDNAMKYSDEGGFVKISLGAYKKGIKFEIYNTTEDIDKENLDKLFDRFYRVDSSRSRETGGYGIGLSIAKSIVEAHHGKISVRSDDGKSICFTVTISNKVN